MKKIDNLPVIQQALGGAREELDPGVRFHYDITPGTNAGIVMQGTRGQYYRPMNRPNTPYLTDIIILFILFFLWLMQ